MSNKVTVDVLLLIQRFMDKLNFLNQSEVRKERIEGKS